MYDPSPQPPVIEGRPLLGAMSALADSSNMYIICDISHSNWKNRWRVERAEVIEWAPPYRINILLWSHGHKYRLIQTGNGQAMFRHIVPKRSTPEVQPLPPVKPQPWYSRLLGRLFHT